MVRAYYGRIIITPGLKGLIELVSYRDVTESIAKASVSYGSGGTIKAARNKRLDLKATAITITGEEKQHESFSSGLCPNITHSGKDSVSTVKSERKLQLFC